ncbi:ACP S-malonyltransferase [bacterium]|nr:ACP S-malonyltransferase [bacterium]
MKTAFIFPGQGSQYIGMGHEFSLSSEQACQLFERADVALGYSLSRLCFEGPAEALQLTENTQPAILTHSFISAHALMQTGLKPDYIAGHSLGEITAVTVMGGMSFEAGVTLVRNRGRYMQEAVPAGLGAMSAIIGLPLEKVVALCAEYSPTRVCVANINNLQQTVISGLRTAVDEVGEKAREAGALRIIPLSVSAPFHSPLMEPAAERLAHDLDQISIQDLPVPLITNADVLPIFKSEDIGQALIKQVVQPVRWLEIIQYLIGQGVTVFVELGPGRVLSGFMRRANVPRTVSTYAVQDPDSLEQVVNQLSRE